MGAKRKTVKIPSKTIPFRKDFFKATKEPTESTEAWLNRVNELAKSCCFGTHNDQFIVSKFVTGLETEVIEYLCSNSQSLDIQSTLKSIIVYEKEKDDLTHNPTPFVDVTEPLIEPPDESIFSESLRKCETEYSSDDSVGEPADEPADEPHDELADDSVDDRNQSDSDNFSSFGNDDSKDSDFVCEIETKKKRTVKGKKAVKIKIEAKNEEKTEDENGDGGTKEMVSTVIAKPRGRKKTKAQTKETTNKAEAQDAKDVKAEEVDPDAPKKKRKYKQRAIKEKQTFECEICHYKCAHQCHLKRHKLTHENQKSFVCQVCGKAFNLFINLNAHIRRHIGYKPHVCELCEKSFLDKAKLKLHMRTHTGEKPFACQYCDKSFADRYYLKKHTRSHTGEKPFQCDQCLKTFSQSSSLGLHKRKSCVIGQSPFGFNNAPYNTSF